MNLSLLKQNGSSYDITDAVTRIEWSGSASQAARQLSFDYINAPFDSYNLPTVSTGDVVSFTPDEEEVFYGQIFGSEKSSVVGTITFTAYDMMRNLLESTGQYNFKNVTPEAVAQKVCSDAQIPIQSVYGTGVNIASMLCDDMSLYDVIMAAYTKAYRITGDKYFPMIYQRGFGVYRSEWIVAGYTIADDENLTSSSISETMDNIVNQVKIYDSNGNQIGEVKDDGSQGTYGVFQKTYKQEEGVNPQSGAQALLSVTPSQSIKISAVGDPNCLSCYFVLVSDGATGLAGKYWISSDKHVWENNAHTMELELRFDSIMDEVESGKEGD